jgi:hypothetical protein
MDTSYWVNLNKTIKVVPTKKQYFNRYLWRLVFNIKKVSVASDKWVHDVVHYVSEHKKEERERSKYNLNQQGYASSYGYSYRRENWVDSDPHLIDRVRTTMRTFKDRAKFRTESDYLQVYAESEQDLQAISQAISGYEHMQVINMPTPGTEDALRNNVVFMNKINYKYKIILRDGNYDLNTKRSILMQLNARDDVKLPPNLKRELGKKYSALWGAYFYSNDDSIATILSLISPGIVGKIHPVEHLQ